MEICGLYERNNEENFFFIPMRMKKCLRVDKQISQNGNLFGLIISNIFPFPLTLVSQRIVLLSFEFNPKKI